MKFRPTAHLDPSQVIDRRGLPGGGLPIDPQLLNLLLNHANPFVKGVEPVYVPGGRPFPWFSNHPPATLPGDARNVAAPHPAVLAHAILAIRRALNGNSA